MSLSRILFARRMSVCLSLSVCFGCLSVCMSVRLCLYVYFSVCLYICWSFYLRFLSGFRNADSSLVISAWYKWNKWNKWKRMEQMETNSTGKLAMGFIRNKEQTPRKTLEFLSEIRLKSFYWIVFYLEWSQDLGFIAKKFWRVSLMPSLWDDDVFRSVCVQCTLTFV